MVTTETWSRRDLFKNERWAKLLIYHSLFTIAARPIFLYDRFVVRMSPRVTTFMFC